MSFDTASRTFECDPTLTDSQVLQFCREGYIMLKGVVPDEINRKTCDWLDGKIPANPSWIPEGMNEAERDRIRASHEPSTILLEDWFQEHVLLNRELCGVMRSLLGRNVGLPVLVSHHRTECPQDAQGWHHDADHVFGPELKFAEVFYFPRDTPAELGPTEIAPGTHFGPAKKEPTEPGILAEGPAGTLGIHHQSILHRRGASTATGIRHMLKYNYWRTVPPEQNWISDPAFDPETADYGGHGIARYVGHMFWWLRGKGEEYRIIGGQGWPWRTQQQIGPSYGYEREEGYVPDWRRGNVDGYAK
jgi:hypothetical protein